MSDKRLFRPASLIRLQIRLEDFGAETDPETIAKEQEPFNQALKTFRNVEARFAAAYGSAIVSKDAGEIRRRRAQLEEVRTKIATITSRDPKARAVTNEPGDLFSITTIVSPIESSVKMDTFRSLDTCTATIAFKDMPLESQAIRSCLIEVYTGTLSAEDFATGALWRLKLDRANLLFRGYADSWATDHGDDDATVKISARSLESILVDSKINPKDPVFKISATGEKISAYVNRILGKVAATSGGRTGGDQFKAVYFGADNERTLSASVFSRALQTSKSKAKAAGGATVLADQGTGGTDTGNVTGTGEPRLSPPVPEDMTAWDLIVYACQAAGGCVPVYDPSIQNPGLFKEQTELPGGGDNPDGGDFLLIRPAHTIMVDVKQGIYALPFDEFSLNKRRLPNPNAAGNKKIASAIRFMVWGRNIRSFQTNRKMGRIKAPVVQVTGYNPDASPAKRTVVVRFPPEKDVRATRIGAKGEGKTEEIVRKNFPEIRDEATLLQYARSLYDQLARPKLSVTIDTDDMSTYVDPEDTATDPNDSPDVLQIRYGTPVRVVVARQIVDPAGKRVTLTPLSELFERRNAELRSWLLTQQQRFRPNLDPEYSEALAELMAARISETVNSPKRVDLFYTKTVQHNWSAQDGWSATMELVNFSGVDDPQNMSSDARKIDQVAKKKPRKKSFKAKADIDPRVLTPAEEEAVRRKAREKFMIQVQGVIPVAIGLPPTRRAQ